MKWKKILKKISDEAKRKAFAVDGFVSYLENGNIITEDKFGNKAIVQTSSVKRVLIHCKELYIAE